MRQIVAGTKAKTSGCEKLEPLTYSFANYAIDIFGITN